MKIIAFSKRNLLEMFRDPIMYIFSIAFPVVMLMLFKIIDSNAGIPGFDFYNTTNMAPRIIVFGYYFIMLDCALLVSKDRAASFLTRLYATPMKTLDFAVGYTLPMFVVALCLTAVSFAAAAIIGAAGGVYFDFRYILLFTVMQIPTVFMCVGFGILAGSGLSDKSAPAVVSVIINAAAILGGAFFDVNSIKGGFLTFCKILPFYQSMEMARDTVNGNTDNILLPFAVCTAYAVAAYVSGIIVFKKKSKN
jgi:ABC-2 type transport system permease protein